MNAVTGARNQTKNELTECWMKSMNELASKDWMTGAGANNLREMNDQRKI